MFCSPVPAVAHRGDRRQAPLPELEPSIFSSGFLEPQRPHQPQTPSIQLHRVGPHLGFGQRLRRFVAPSRCCSERGTPSFGGQGRRWKRQSRWRRPRRPRRSRRSKHYLEKVTTSWPRTVEVQNRFNCFAFCRRLFGSFLGLPFFFGSRRTGSSSSASCFRANGLAPDSCRRVSNSPEVKI